MKIHVIDVSSTFHQIIFDFPTFFQQSGKLSEHPPNEIAQAYPGGPGKAAVMQGLDAPGARFKESPDVLEVCKIS